MHCGEQALFLVEELHLCMKSEDTGRFIGFLSCLFNTSSFSMNFYIFGNKFTLLEYFQNFLGLVLLRC